jgi:hypothetical protein
MNQGDFFERDLSFGERYSEAPDFRGILTQAIIEQRARALQKRDTE